MEDAGSGELRISDLNFAAGFAGRYAPFKKGRLAKCQLGTVKGCMKGCMYQTLNSFPLLLPGNIPRKKGDRTGE